MPSNERIGTALNSKNLKSDETHFDADLVAALAHASKLGATLQMLISGGFAEELRPASDELARVLKKACRRRNWGIGWQAAQRASRQGLIEWMMKACRGCNGTGKTLLNYGLDSADQKEQDCPLCEGVGEFVPEWHWRSQQMGLGPDEPQAWWTKRVDLAKEIAGDAFHTARRQVNRQLE